MNGRIKVWGRTADGHPHQVVVERKVNGKWRSVKKPTANAYGILSARWRSSDRTHVYRARVPGGAHSNGFSLKKPRFLPPQHLGLRRHDPLPLALTVS